MSEGSEDYTGLLLPALGVGVGVFALVMALRKRRDNGQGGQGGQGGQDVGQQGKDTERLDKTPLMPTEQAKELQANINGFLDFANLYSAAADRFPLRAPTSNAFDDDTLMALLVCQKILKAASTQVYLPSHLSKVSVVPHGKFGKPVEFTYDLAFGLSDRPESVVLSQTVLDLLKRANSVDWKPGDKAIIAQTLASLGQDAKFRALTR